MQNEAKTIEDQMFELRRYIEKVDAHLALLARLEFDATGHSELADRATRDLYKIASRLYTDAVVPV